MRRRVMNAEGTETPDAEDLEGKSPEEIEQIMKDKGWKGEKTRNGEGTRYPNPNKKGEQVRVQKGDPNNPNPAKRGPYVRVSKGGKISPPTPLK